MPTTATSAPPPPESSHYRGTVHSLDRARRRRSHRSTAQTIRVLVVGGHALTRAGLVHLLEEDPDLVVVGTVGSGHEAEALARSAEPHVVLVDADSWAPDPVASTHALSGRTPVLLLTACEADDRVLSAVRAGATGVLAKESHPAELASAVRTLAAGGALLPPSTTRRLISELVARSSA